jgi:hypothetical protein
MNLEMYWATAFFIHIQRGMWSTEGLRRGPAVLMRQQLSTLYRMDVDSMAPCTTSLVRPCC